MTNQMLLLHNLNFESQHHIWITLFFLSYLKKRINTIPKWNQATKALQSSIHLGSITTATTESSTRGQEQFNSLNVSSYQLLILVLNHCLDNNATPKQNNHQVQLFVFQTDNPSVFCIAEWFERIFSRRLSAAFKKHLKRDRKKYKELVNG